LIIYTLHEEIALIRNRLQTSERAEHLRQRMNSGEHWRHRVPRPAELSTAQMDCSLPERKAHALRLMCEQMPVAIGPEELIVGMRTFMPPENSSAAVWASILPDYYRDEAESALYTHGHAATHNVPAFSNVFRHGLGGLAGRARARPADEPDPAKQNNLASFAIACEAVGALSRRYAQAASGQAKDTADNARRAELEAVADICRHIATKPPRHLHDALQLHWFVWLATILEVGCLVTSGRLDQLLAPFWPADPAEQQWAHELLDCYVIKCNDQTDYWAGTSLVNNNIMLSGLRPDGADGTNDVTWAILDSMARLMMPDPQAAVRLHKNSPPEFIHYVARLLRDGVSQISVYNDDVFVPSLAGAGFPIVDARDYALDACQDVNIADKSEFYLAANIPLTQTFLKALEASPDDVDWETFFRSYQALVAEEIDRHLTDYCANIKGKPSEPCPFLSAPMDDCIATGLDVANGGLRYRDKGVFLAEPVCAINSLAAIRCVVYENRDATLAEVKAACKANYVGYEHLRRKLQAAPKWGNDDDAADLIGKELLDTAAREIIRHRIDEEAGFLAGVHQPHHVACGRQLPATPDGRRDGDPLSVTLAPTNGTALRGPTAVMRSVTKLDPMLCQWNSSLTMTFDPVFLAGEAGLEKFAALIRAYLAMGGPQLQVNCISADTLRAAQRDPASYEDLIVRVWGYCDRFTSLSPEYQKELIDRTAHAV